MMYSVAAELRLFEEGQDAIGGQAELHGSAAVDQQLHRLSMSVKLIAA